MRKTFDKIARSEFRPTDIPQKVMTTEWLYVSDMVKRIQEGYANGCDYVTALGLFNIAKGKGLFEYELKTDKYRIKRESNGTT